MKYKNTAIVVEGGGLRGSYAGGVLDVLADKEIKFGGACGTSAGATHLCSFLSGQIGRNFRVDTVHSKSPRYMSFMNLLLTTSMGLSSPDTLTVPLREVITSVMSVTISVRSSFS